MDNKKYFDILQIFRGIAALMVVVHHCYISFEYFKGLDVPMLKFIASLGKFGVDFFFVLSGFIIAYTTFNYRNENSYLKTYFINRVLRIYIPYIPISIGLLILYYFLPQLSGGDRAVSILTSLTLIPNGSPALSVAWTLVFEMMFYFFFALNFISVIIWRVFLSLWIGLIVYFSYINPFQFEFVFFNNLTDPYNLEFILGVFIAITVRKQLILNKILVLFLGTSLFILFLIMKYQEFNFFPFSQNLMFAISIMFIVYFGVIYLGFPIKKSNVVMIVGNASYSLYLLHNPLQSFFVRLLPKTEVQILVFLEFLLTIFICCIFSYLYYLIFEKRAISIVKSRLML